MADTEAVGKFIKAVRQHFPTPQKSDEDERDWVRSMAYVLRDYVASELALAAEKIITTREARGFPSPSECLKACAFARQIIKTRIGASNSTAQWPKPEFSATWTRERQREADNMIRCDLGRQAATAKPRWLLGLWNFCREHQRLPQPPEIERIKKNAAEHKRLVADIKADKQVLHNGKLVHAGGAAPRAWEKLGETMLAKERELVAKVLS